MVYFVYNFSLTDVQLATSFLIEYRCFVIYSVSFVTSSTNVGWRQKLKEANTSSHTFHGVKFWYHKSVVFSVMSVFIVRVDSTCRTLSMPFSSATCFGSLMMAKTNETNSR